MTKYLSQWKQGEHEWIVLNAIDLEWLFQLADEHTEKGWECIGEVIFSGIYKYQLLRKEIE